MMTSALKWGAIIGGVNMLWLYLAYYLGLHTSGIMVFQVFMLIWLILNIAAYTMALRAIRLEGGSWGYWRGVGLGTLASVVAAVLAVVAQVGYFKVVHPAWPDFMVEQTREFFEGQGKTAEELEKLVAEARQYFTLENYSKQSGVSAFFLGFALSMAIMLFLRRPVGEQPEPSGGSGNAEGDEARD